MFIYSCSPMSDLIKKSAPIGVQIKVRLIYFMFLTINNLQDYNHSRLSLKSLPYLPLTVSVG